MPKLNIKIVRLTDAEKKRRIRAALRSCNRPNVAMLVHHDQAKIKFCEMKGSSFLLEIADVEMDAEELLTRLGFNVEHLVELMLERLNEPVQINR